MVTVVVSGSLFPNPWDVSWRPRTQWIESGCWTLPIQLTKGIDEKENSYQFLHLRGSKKKKGKRKRKSVLSIGHLLMMILVPTVGIWNWGLRSLIMYPRKIIIGGKEFQVIREKEIIEGILNDERTCMETSPLCSSYTNPTWSSLCLMPPVVPIHCWTVRWLSFLCLWQIEDNRLAFVAFVC